MQSERVLKAVIVALEDARFKWRTISGIATDAHLSEREVWQALEELRRAGIVIRSAIQSEKGEDLYTTRQHYKQFASLSERLSAVLKNRAS